MKSLARSFLYVPADNLDRLLQSDTRGADAIIADLEDSQTASSRPQALANVETLLRTEAFKSQIWVRIFPDELETQLPFLASTELTGIVLPEVSLGALSRLDDALAELEAHLGQKAGITPVVGLVESGTALRDIHSIAEHPRVSRLGMGEADLCADIGITDNGRETALLSLRLQVAIASAAAGIQSPIGSTSTNYSDLDDLHQSTAALYGLGFRARTAIHPRQIKVINSVFTPTREEVEEAKRIIALLEAAKDAGRGVTIDPTGNMIDTAVVRSAYDVIARAATP